MQNFFNKVNAAVDRMNAKIDARFKEHDEWHAKAQAFADKHGIENFERAMRGKELKPR